jgi:hypothetical protein
MSTNSNNDEPEFGLLEARLGRAGRHLAYPPTPDVGAKLRGRLRDDHAVRRARSATPGLRWAVTAITTVSLFFGSLAVPEVRAFWDGILRRVGVVEVVLMAPTPVTSAGTPSPTPFTSKISMAGEMTMAEARATLPYQLKVPSYTAGHGEPDRVFVQDIGGPASILLWSGESPEDAPELVLFALTSRSMGRKHVHDSDMLAEAQVGAAWGLWIRGPHLVEFGGGTEPHEFFRRLETRRLVGGNTLLWAGGDDGLTYRLETRLPLEEAVKIAESLR